MQIIPCIRISPFPQNKLPFIHTRYLVFGLSFDEEYPFVEDFPSEYFHSKDSSWLNLAFARVSEGVEVVDSEGTEELDLDVLIDRRQSWTKILIQRQQEGRISWDEHTIEDGCYHCFIADRFDEGVYDFGKCFCRDSRPSNNGWIPIHALFPCQTRFFHGWNACTWGTAILQVFFWANCHFLQNF